MGDLSPLRRSWPGTAGAALRRSLGYTLVGISVVTAAAGFLAAATGRHIVNFVVPFWGYLAIAYMALLFALVVRETQHRAETDDLRHTVTAKEAEIAARFSAVQYRLQPSHLLFKVGQFQDDAGALQTGYQFTVMLANVGTDPIEFEVQSPRISLGSYTTPAGKKYGGMGGVILPGVPQGFSYLSIPAPLPAPGTLPPRGAGEFSLVYGHPAGGPRFRKRYPFVIGWELDGNNLTVGWEFPEKATDEPVTSQGLSSGGTR